jgi:hypothetical protein
MAATMLSHDSYVQGEAHLRAEPQRHFWVFDVRITHYMNALFARVLRVRF